MSIDLSFANLSKAHLSEVNLQHANLIGINLSGASLDHANLENANLIHAELNNVDLNHARLKNSQLYSTHLRGAILNNALLGDAILSAADLSGSDLDDADLSGALLIGTNLKNTKLRQSNLVGANLSRADLSQADLGQARLTSTSMNDTILKGANLSHTDLTYAHLFGCSLEEVNWTNVQIGWTQLNDLDLQTIQGLETVKHEGPSTIGLDTIYRSGGKIPEIFLRKAGVPASFIEYMYSLTVLPIDFYSCFISYSSKDKAFAERLYADLQNKGVRCWFAPHDMKIGDKIRHRIDESIRLYDKLLLVLSVHSINSQWVEHEVEMALAKERGKAQTVLFPVRLDNAILERNQDGWPAEVRHTRHIGNFEQWKDHDQYQNSFQRLLRDLQSRKISNGE
ncbi:hypothetical protein KSF_088900 [Reticulibacter mediterranei]|uniref:TIR domain-containing protein n=1 Tax=Reticulibacter mediterranei TaxID=2778369 RepID=A0A8J3N527_9CHLR|nr:hypothetical protein KSF_088900 [Reticulibacter mediterranei]